MTEPKVLIVAARTFAIDVFVPFAQAINHKEALAIAKGRVAREYPRSQARLVDIQLQGMQYLLTLQVTQEL